MNRGVNHLDGGRKETDAAAVGSTPEAAIQGADPRLHLWAFRPSVTLALFHWASCMQSNNLGPFTLLRDSMAHSVATILLLGCLMKL